MDIRKATKADLDAVESSYRELLQNIKPEENYSGWILDVYPNRKWAEENLENLWVLMEGETLGASMILNHNQPEDYKSIPWEIPAAPEQVTVIHTLCVPPNQAGKGYGKTMVRFAIDESRRQGMTAMRLDTAKGNKPATKLYTGCGFAIRGARQVIHQGVIPEELIFFELGLSNF